MLPLSGQMTQAVQQAPAITIHQQEVTNSAVNLLPRSVEDHKKEGEPASKKIKLEVVEQVDLLEDETDADLELHQDDDIEESIKASSDTDDDMLPFPLTFRPEVEAAEGGYSPCCVCDSQSETRWWSAAVQGGQGGEGKEEED